MIPAISHIADLKLATWNRGQTTVPEGPGRLETYTLLCNLYSNATLLRMRVEGYISSIFFS